MSQMKRNKVHPVSGVSKVKLVWLNFETESAKEEAAGFYDANTNRRLPTSLAKWRAQLLRGDSTTIYVDGLITQAGRQASNTTGPGEVRCLTALLRAADADRELLARVWPLILEVFQGQALHERMLEGLVWVESNMPDGP